MVFIFANIKIDLNTGKREEICISLLKNLVGE